MLVLFCQQADFCIGVTVFENTASYMDVAIAHAHPL